MAPIQKNGVLTLDNAAGAPTPMTSVVAFMADVEQTTGEYGTLPTKWKNTMDGRRSFRGSFKGIAETAAAAGQLRAICRDWILSANKPGARTMKMDCPDSLPGSETFSGEIRITRMSPMVDADAMSDDALVTTIDFVGDGALTSAIIV